MHRAALCAFLSITLFGCVAASAQNTPAATLTLDVAHARGQVSPMLYGLMTEEINHAFDGGLYAEMVRDRAMTDHAFGPHGWLALEQGHARATLLDDQKSGPSQVLTDSLRVTITVADTDNLAGVTNTGFWGMAVQPQTEYKGSFYAKADHAWSSPLAARLVSDRTGAVLAKATVSGVGTGWQRYTFTLHTSNVPDVSVQNHLELAASEPGSLWFSLVSLFPPTYKSRLNGFRPDLMEKLDALHPAFLRLPGGNYLEGDHIKERFEWKQTIGPWVDRPTHRSPWNYQSSDGMGLLEMLEWCEDLHMEPVLAVYAGYSLQQEHVDPGSTLEPYVKDALEEIEYVTGDVHTKWGAVRVRDGHPAPFAVRYVEIGNEDEFDKSHSYDGRYAQFYKAIKASYPQLQLIATTDVHSVKPDVIDEHFYRSANEFFADAHHYDKTDRNGPKIFVGEWATNEGSPTPDLGAALADAAWLTGLERNSDLVIMASYAPLFANVNPEASQWFTNLIGYDALSSFGSPSYYAQVMFGAHVGKEIVDAKIDGGNPRFFSSATRDPQTGLLYLKLVNGSSVPQGVSIHVNGAKDIAAQADVTTLAGHSPQETNTVADPRRIVPANSTRSGVGAAFDHTVPAYSVQLIQLHAR